MKISDYRPTNPFSGILFTIGLLFVGLAVGVSTVAAIHDRFLWIVAATCYGLGAIVCFTVVRSLERRRARDGEDAKRDAEEDAADLEGDL